MKIGSKNFVFGGHTYLVGILNITPDSFSDGGSYSDFNQAMRQVEKMAASGVDVIDVGGESTRPNYTMISEEEEICRVIPVIKGIKERWDIPVSIDTYKSGVAEAAAAAGADMVNDIWGLRYDKKMAGVVKESGLPVCLMHNRKEKQDKIANADFWKLFLDEVEESLNIAHQAGISDDRIILDPGVGFGKSYEQNLYCIRHLEDLKALGYPVLLGVSRKSVIGLTLDLPVTMREEGTQALSVLAAAKGCDFVRVHDVEGNRRAIAMAEAVLHVE